MPAPSALHLVVVDRPSPPTSPAASPVVGGPLSPELLALIRAMAWADAERDARAQDSTPAESGVTVRP